MSWYEDVLESVDVPLKSQYVETSFGRTHMLVCGPENAEARRELVDFMLSMKITCVPGIWPLVY